MIVLNYENENYPSKLRDIANPPKRLYLLGNIHLLNQFNIAIIGCRECTEYGKKVSKDISFKLSKKKINIISGLAKGIDSYAHIGCLAAEGKTIAVLGSGFNNIYPKENYELFKEIIKKDGVIISEYSPEVKPKGSNFPERNRLISGLSDGIIVVEAKMKSGTSITVNHALEQGKNVFAIPRKHI